jgi:hypothetical protein
MAKRRTYLLRITLTPEEELEAKAAAAMLGVSLAALARMSLFRLIRAQSEGLGKTKKPAPTR